MDWIDDLLDDSCELYQITTIESLMQTSSVANEYLDVELEKLSNIEANAIIKHLYDNDNPRDPREQFKRMFRDGN
jgi:hypothetical protein